MKGIGNGQMGLYIGQYVTYRIQANRPINRALWKVYMVGQGDLFSKKFAQIGAS